MSTTRRVLTATAVGALVVLATAGVPPSFRAAAAVLVTATVAIGQRWRLPTVVAAGLLGLVIVVGAGAAAAGPLGLLGWAMPTWAVVLLAARALPPGTPPPRDARVRVRQLRGDVAAVVASVPLGLVAAGGSRVAPVWAAAGGAALVGLLLVTLRRSPGAERAGPRP